MYISRVEIKNFRNFCDFSVDLSDKAVLLGENGAGKSNFFEAIRIVLDSSYRSHLTDKDFFKGVTPYCGTKIEIHVYLTGFDKENDKDLLAAVADCIVSKDPDPIVAQISYIYAPDAKTEPEKAVNDDYYEGIFCSKGDTQNREGAKRARRYIKFVLVSALRDMERDMQNWRISPMGLLSDQMELAKDPEFIEIASQVEQASRKLRTIQLVENLQGTIRKIFERMIGGIHSSSPSIGLFSSDPVQLQRALTILVDHDLPFDRASLGLTNVLYLTLLVAYYTRLRTSTNKDRSRQYTIIAVEEPESHLHPHLQRLVFEYLFSEELNKLPIMVSTHSSTLVSIAKPDWIVILRRGENGTGAASTANLRSWDSKLKQELSRFLDATRGEAVFSKGVLLVEGDAEMFLIPAFAKALKDAGVIDSNLDEAGISVCNIYGTDFKLYAQFFGKGGLEIPIAILTDGDLHVGISGMQAAFAKSNAVTQDGKDRLGDFLDAGALRKARELLRTAGFDDSYFGLKRGIEIVAVRDRVRSSEINVFYDEHDWQKVSDELEKEGIFVNKWTLEDELIEAGYEDEFIDTYLELGASDERRQAMRNQIQADKVDKVINRISETGFGKGRFAQRLADKVDGDRVPQYIQKGITYILERVPRSSPSTVTLFPSEVAGIQVMPLEPQSDDYSASQSESSNGIDSSSDTNGRIGSQLPVDKLPPQDSTEPANSLTD